MSRPDQGLVYLDESLRLGRIIRRKIQCVAKRCAPSKADPNLSYFFFAKGLTSLAAIRALWANRFYQDAVVITRSIFEACVQILYIQTDPAHLSVRYLEYESVERRDFSVGTIRSLKSKSRLPSNKKGATAARD